MSENLRVVALADADSFVKWSASMLGSVEGINAHILIVRTELVASREQERSALVGSGLTGEVTRVSHSQIEQWLQQHRPDVVLIGGRGPFVRLMGRIIDKLAHRPVTVSGFPGMAMPAQRGALTYRRYTDLLVVHSHREQRAFAELASRLGITMNFALATMPFARLNKRAKMRSLMGARSAGAVLERNSAREPQAVFRRATDVVFAAQALVPLTHEDRAALAAILVRTAEANPSRTVVVKLRSRPGEAETHPDRDPYTALLGQGRPDNLVFSYGPMARSLDSAAGLVTISSTAAIEAIARGVPVIALDTFGVSKSLLNTVFVGSGLLGNAHDVVSGNFRSPRAEWMKDNYFHPTSQSTWWSEVEKLVAQRRAGELPARKVPPARGGALHEAWQRVSVLGRADNSFSGRVAMLLGTPLARLAAMLKRRKQTGQSTWDDATTDYTLEPNPFQDSLRR